LFARYKGSLFSAVEGAKALDNLMDGDTILISEGCTHHRQCDDIGTVKLPRGILDYLNRKSGGSKSPDGSPSADIKFAFTYLLFSNC
jgi:hypothetical protein